jgi:CheY-like chemotaxis protein
MTRIQTLSQYEAPADYHGRHGLRTDNLMNLCLNNDMHPGGRKRKTHPTNGRHVMLVQRRTIELQAMTGILSVLGYCVTAAKESDEALFYFGRDPCELVISELDMPQLNGFQLARCIRKHSPRTRILVMTACCQAEVADYMDSQVVDGWLFKPFRLSVLSDMLKEVEWTI